MGITFEIYTKKRPDLSDLIKPLKLERIDELEGFNSFKWIPINSIEPVYIIQKEGAEIYFHNYDEQLINDMIHSAKHGKHDVPKEFVDKLRRDNYCLFIDRGLAKIIKKYPDLKQAFPFLINEFTIAEFSNGRPLYKIEIECGNFITIESLKSMRGIAKYIISGYDGLVYLETTNRYHLPSDEELLNIIM